MACPDPNHVIQCSINHSFVTTTIASLSSLHAAWLASLEHGRGASSDVLLR